MELSNSKLKKNSYISSKNFFSYISEKNLQSLKNKNSLCSSIYVPLYTFKHLIFFIRIFFIAIFSLEPLESLESSK